MSSYSHIVVSLLLSREDSERLTSTALSEFLPPANKVCLFVCLSVCQRGVCLPHSPPPDQRQTPLADTSRQTPPGRHPPRKKPLLGRHTPPWADTRRQCMLGYGQQAVGTHPTEMHSCLTCLEQESGRGRQNFFVSFQISKESKLCAIERRNGCVYSNLHWKD